MKDTNTRKLLWPIIVVVVILSLAVYGASGDSEDQAADTTGTPSASVPMNTPTPTPDASEELSPEPSPDSTPEPTDNVSLAPTDEPTAEAPTMEDPIKEEPLVFELVAGKAGEYGELFTINKDTEFEETYYIYHIPVGTYAITNSGKYMAQISVYSDKIVVNSSGWEEPAETLFGEVLDIKESVTVTIPEGYFIEIHEPARFTFELNK